MKKAEATQDLAIAKVQTELKWHRWILIALLAAVLSGVRVFDPVLFRWP